MCSTGLAMGTTMKAALNRTEAPERMLTGYPHPRQVCKTQARLPILAGVSECDGKNRFWSKTDLDLNPELPGTMKQATWCRGSTSVHQEPQQGQLCTIVPRL